MTTVLIVDDDAGTRDTYAALLRLEGINCLLAADGASALRMSQQAPVDLVLLDLHLPDRSGLEILDELKQQQPSRLVVIVTAFPTFESSFDAGALASDGYVEDPLLADELISVVRQGLDRHLPIRNGVKVPMVESQPSGKRTESEAPDIDIRVRQVAYAIERSPATAIEDHAASVNLSVSRLRHSFTRAFRQSPAQFRHKRRLEMAAERLRTSWQRASEIAYELGFLPSSLDKAFKRRFGMSPTEYRSKYRETARPPGDARTIRDKE